MEENLWRYIFKNACCWKNGVDEKNQTEQQDSSSGSLLQRSSRRRQRHSCESFYGHVSDPWLTLHLNVLLFWIFFKQIPAQPRDAKMIHSIASLIRAKSKLLLLENPDTVEIYKVGKNLEQHANLMKLVTSPFFPTHDACKLQEPNI